MELLFEIFLVGAALSADSFSAALAMGFKPHSKYDAIKFGLSSGTAEALAASVGAFAGAKIIARFSAYDHWIAFGLLMAVALHMLKEGIDGIRGEGPGEDGDFHGFFKILLVSFATSLDALGVGVGLGVSQGPVFPYIISIGLWAFLATLMGLYLARRIPRVLGPMFSFFGAGVLTLLAVKMLEI